MGDSIGIIDAMLRLLIMLPSGDERLSASLGQFYPLGTVGLDRERV